MNRRRPTDSELSLDTESFIGDDPAMMIQPYQLYVERTEPSKNMARYYAMSIEPTLFGTACLTRRWGRIGKKGQEKVHHFQREEDAVHLFLDVLRQKRARGYLPTGASRTNRTV
jgi:predicted DNA-binding WGR domain protein